MRGATQTLNQQAHSTVRRRRSRTRGGRGLPAECGCYALVLRLAAPRTLDVGALGRVYFPAGTYIYCGSAWGAGGLRARVGHHLSRGAAARWHVDVLRRIARPIAVGLWPGAPRAHECLLASALASQPGACRFPAHFGSSDCRCPGHLVWFDRTADALTSTRLFFDAAGAALAH